MGVFVVAVVEAALRGPIAWLRCAAARRVGPRPLAARALLLKDGAAAGALGRVGVGRDGGPATPPPGTWLRLAPMRRVKGEVCIDIDALSMALLLV